MTAVISSSASRTWGTAQTRPPGGTDMYGRDEQRRIVGELLRKAGGGTGGVLLVEGDRGMGKSLLLEEAAREASARGFSLATGAADRLGSRMPLFSLRMAVGVDGDDGDPGFWPSKVARLQERLVRRAETAPVLVTLDDVQWAHQETMLALRVLPRELARHPIAWILCRSPTNRNKDAEYLFSALEREGARRVHLQRLDAAMVTAVLTDAFGAPPDARVLTLAEGAGGNPSLLTDLIGGLREEDLIRVTSGHASLVADRVPARVVRGVRRWFDDVGEHAGQVLETAAVLGGQFRLGDVAAVLDITPGALLPRVEEALRAGLLVVGDDTFSFRYGLIARAVSQSVPRPVRRVLHRQLGEILLGRAGMAAEAARHLLRGATPGDPDSVTSLDAGAAQTLQEAPRVAADLALRAWQLTCHADLAAVPRAVAPLLAAAAATEAMLAWNQGRTAEGVELLRDAARQWPGVPSDARRAQPVLLLAARLIDLRRPDEASAILDSAEDGATGLATAVVSLLRARLYMANGRPDEAAPAAEAALAAAELAGADGYVSAARSVLALIALRQGNQHDAAQHVGAITVPLPYAAAVYAPAETALAGARVIEASQTAVAVLGQLRELCADPEVRNPVLLGDPALAVWLVRTALAAGDRRLAGTAVAAITALASDGNPAIMAAAAHARGLLDASEELLAKAAITHTDPWARASAAEDLAMLPAGGGPREVAIQRLDEALGGYGAVGATADTARVRARLRGFGIRRRHWGAASGKPVDGWESLTETERAVCELIAEGLTNRQAATRMYISVHTVSHHLRQTFRKLRIGSRVELARIVVERSQT
jgi:DNA-binding CsgD family transcriptional regulator/tetratricopeptide (TPR) repeat protein